MSWKAPLLGILLLTGVTAAAAAAADGQALAPRPGQRDPAPAPPTGSAPVREPEAIAALERMGAYLRTLTTFQVSAEGSTEEALESGQTIQYPGSIDLMVTRPNRLRADLISTRKRREYYFDGRNLTVFAPRQGFYATIEAPGTIKDMLDRASERMDLTLPFVDLFELGTDPALTARITTAFFVATDVIGDQVCNHFAFRQPGVDWQIWIRDGQQPLPCKWVITGMDDPNQLDYEMTFTWDLTTPIPEGSFTFVPPEGADRIAIASTAVKP